MKKGSILFLLLAGIALTFYGCCKAGTGGKATIVCNVINSNTGAAVTNATVYVLYGSSKPPATIDKFNDHKATGTYASTATFSGMKCGTYYLYATGYDSAVSLPLKGGGPYSLQHSKRNQTGSATISVSY